MSSTWSFAARVRAGASCAVAVALAGCAAGPRAPSQSSPSRDDAVTVNIAFPVEELHLPNGLHVILHQERSATSALVYVRYHVGSKDDPQGRSGFAHFFEHLMFRGSKNTGSKDYEQWIEEIGGDSNAGTDLDTTDYHAAVPPSELPRAIWLEADRMAYPLAAVDDKAFDHERDVVKNEWRQHYEDVPLGNLRAIALEAVFGPSHPYGTTTIGRGEELDKATLEEARAFARRYYRPNNATLLVCGLFDLPTARALVTRYFGTIPAAPAPRARSFPPARLAYDERITVEAGVDAPAVVLAWPAPETHGDGSDELRYGLSYFRASARQRLVTKMKIANDLETTYITGRFGGLVMVTAKLKPGASTDSAITALEEHLSETTRLGRQWDWDRFKDYKTQALVGEIGDLEGLKGRAQRILHDIELHGGPNAVQTDLKRLQSVHPADVGAAVERYLVDAHRVTMIVRPTANAPRSGKKVAR